MMGPKTWLFLTCAIVVAANQPSQSKDLSPVQWNGGLTKSENGQEICNGLATRAQIYKDSAFLCIPRLKPGCQATLVKTSMLKDKSGKYPMEPFPSWKPQTEGDCECLQSAVDVFLDHTGILWVLDVGATHTLHSQPSHRCPPKILGIDINTGKIVKAINLGSLVNQISRLQFLVADYSDDGQCFLYVSDAGAKTVIVWNVAQNSGYRVMLPNNVLPDYSPRDVLYIALMRRENANNLLFFSYRSGEDLFCIETKDLHSESNDAASKAWNVGKKPTKMIMLGTDDWDCMYFRYENKVDVYKWNSATPFEESNFQLVHSGSGPLIPTHAIPDYNRGVMRIVESNLVEYLSNGAQPCDAINSLTVMQVV